MNLPIVQEGAPSSAKIPRWMQLKSEREAHYERKWLREKDPFPLEPLWFERSWSFLEKVLAPEELVIADVGSGTGEVTRRLLRLGKEVDAIDIASNALKNLEDETSLKLRRLKEAMPRTKLEDGAYDAVVSMDLIGELEETEYRLFFSELARIGKRQSLAVVSTSIDPTTERGVERFLSLFATEYEIEAVELGYLRFKLPSKWLMIILEKIREFIFAERGVTQIIVSGRKRTLL